MPPAPLTRLRRLCLRLPDAIEKVSHGAPTFFVAKGKVFAMFASRHNHHGAGRDAVWLNAAPGNQALMIRTAPRYCGSLPPTPIRITDKICPLSKPSSKDWSGSRESVR